MLMSTRFQHDRKIEIGVRYYRCRMRSYFQILFAEAYRTVRRPARLRRAIGSGALRDHFRHLRTWRLDLDLARRTPGWTNSTPSGDFRRRAYSDYDEYVASQTAKLETLNLTRHHERFGAALRIRLKDVAGVSHGTSVVCMGARQGTEVEAFIDLGCFAIGIDLNPGNNNNYVVAGDFQKTIFAAESVDTVFTNSIDHSFRIDGAIMEARRVLKPRGIYIVEAGQGTDEGGESGFYEATEWKSTSDICDLITNSGFALQTSREFAYPWQGTQLVFSKIT